MSYAKLLWFIIGSALIVLSVAGCNPISVPVVEAPIATSTPMPPTEAPTSPPEPVSTPQSTKPTPLPTTVVKAEKITSQALAGNLLGDPAERTVFVVLPPGYEASEKHYPVVFVMPGGSGSPGVVLSGVKSAMESLLRKGEIQEMILVVPDGTNSLSGGLFLNSPTLGNYEAYVTEELINYVDTHLRTIPTRDSRGIAGCSRGGTTSMRFALKYPNLFSVVASTSGEWDNSPEVWPTDRERVQRLRELPKKLGDLDDVTGWWIQMAAGAAPDPDNPPFYAEMPFRIVDGHGEFVPEVVAKILELDATRELPRYLQQPMQLRGIRIEHGSYDDWFATSIASFMQVINDLGVEHEYVEVPGGHCPYNWEADTLKYLSEKLVFEE